MLVFVSLVFLLAGCIKGVVGMGLPTVAMGLLAQRMPPPEAAALLLIPSLATNLWQAFAGPDLARLIRRLWPMLAGVTLGTLLGMGWMVKGHDALANGSLGAVLILYGLSGLTAWKPRLATRQEPWAGPLVGVLTGLMTGATGVFVLPAVPYLQALGLDKERLIQALGLSFGVSTVALAVGLWQHDALQSTQAGLSLVLLMPTLLGLGLGQWLRRRLSETRFRRLFFSGLILLGAHGLANALGA